MHDQQQQPPMDGAPDASPKPDPDGSGLGWKIAAGIALIAAFVAMGALGSLLLFGGGSAVGDDVRACIVDPASRDFTSEGKKDGHAKPPNCPPEGSTKTDGLVQKTTDGGFTLRSIRKGRLADTVKLYVREPDRPYIDIAHAQTHAALGQPIRVYTLQIDGRKSVVYMEDAPLLS